MSIFIPDEDFEIDVVNEYGVKVNYAEAVNLMDDDIRESLCGDYDKEQEFFDAYCKVHEQKYGEPFEFAKPNPVA